MKTLSTPPYLFFNGEIVPWDQGQVHIWSETAIRAANVFEGVRAYWTGLGWNIVAWDLHMLRLQQSARLMRIPNNFGANFFLQGLIRLLECLDYREDMYIRPTIYIEHGAYGYKPDEVDIGCYIVAFPVPRETSRPSMKKCLVSTWRRIQDLNGLPRAKTGANYQNVRLPRIEATERGFDDAILLNQSGLISELTGASLFIVRNGRVSTPRLTDGILESITRQISIGIIQEYCDTSVTERAIDRTELYVADEIFSTGTLSEISAVVQVDDLKIADGLAGPITRFLAKQYDSLVTSNDKDNNNNLIKSIGYRST